MEKRLEYDGSSVFANTVRCNLVAGKPIILFLLNKNKKKKIRKRVKTVNTLKTKYYY